MTPEEKDARSVPPQSGEDTMDETPDWTEKETEIKRIMDDTGFSREEAEAHRAKWS